MDGDQHKLQMSIYYEIWRSILPTYNLKYTGFTVTFFLYFANFQRLGLVRREINETVVNEIFLFHEMPSFEAPRGNHKCVQFPYTDESYQNYVEKLAKNCIEQLVQFLF